MIIENVDFVFDDHDAMVCYRQKGDIYCAYDEIPFCIDLDDDDDFGCTQVFKPKNKIRSNIDRKREKEKEKSYIFKEIVSNEDGKGFVYKLLLKNISTMSSKKSFSRRQPSSVFCFVEHNSNRAGCFEI
jgi:hypothetical protein